MDAEMFGMWHAYIDGEPTTEPGPRFFLCPLPVRKPPMVEALARRRSLNQLAGRRLRAGMAAGRWHTQSVDGWYSTPVFSRPVSAFL